MMNLHPSRGEGGGRGCRNTPSHFILQKSEILLMHQPDGPLGCNQNLLFMFNIHAAVMFVHSICLIID